MSISDEIARISQNISDSLDEVAAKGVTVPTGSNSNNLPTLISQIAMGPGSGDVLPLYGSYSTIEAAAAAVWDDMSDGAFLIGRFTVSSAYVFLAYRNSANYANMLCWSYGVPIRHINKVNGTISTWRYSYTT